MRFPHRSNIPIIALLLLLANQPVFSAVLDITNSEALYQSEMDFQKTGADDNLTEQRKVLAEQYSALVKAKAISKETGHVNKEFLEAFKKLAPVSEDVLTLMTYAFSSKPYQHQPGSDSLVELVKALQYGVPIHEGMLLSATQHNLDDIVSIMRIILNKSMRTTPSLMQQAVAQMVTSFLKNLNAYETHDQLIKFIELMLDYNAVPTLYSSQPIPLKQFQLSQAAPTDCTNSNQSSHIALLRNCKTSLNLRSPVKLADQNDFFNAINQQLSLEERENLALTPLDIKDRSNPLIEVLEHCTGLEGAMYIVFFKGEEKYQFFSIGAYKDSINLSFAADNKAPVPVVSLNYKTDRINKKEMISVMHRFMNGRHPRNAVPEFVAAWRISVK